MATYVPAIIKLFSTVTFVEDKQMSAIIELFKSPAYSSRILLLGVSIPL